MKQDLLGEQTYRLAKLATDFTLAVNDYLHKNQPDLLRELRTREPREDRERALQLTRDILAAAMENQILSDQIGDHDPDRLSLIVEQKLNYEIAPAVIALADIFTQSALRVMSTEDLCAFMPEDGREEITGELYEITANARNIAAVCRASPGCHPQRR